MLSKEGKQRVPISCKYVGFEVPDEFVVGYGLDYAEQYRNLPYIGVLQARRSTRTSAQTRRASRSERS